MNDRNDVTILVSSCDKYADAWEPFFKLFHIKCPDCPYRILFNTESKNYSCDDLSIETVHTGACQTWTERIKASLEKIDTEFVLFFLEDFFLLSPVNPQSWQQALDCMKKHPDVGFMCFHPNGPFNQPLRHRSVIDTNLYETKKNENFRINATVGLWRKEFLLQMLFRDGDAWYFEWSATKLSKYSNYKTTFWDRESVRIFDYEINLSSGLGIFRGKWLSGNKKLFETYHLTVNFENLGMIDENSIMESVKAENQSTNRHFKKFKRFLRHKKSQLHDIKRFPKLYYKFKKYCKAIHQNQNNI